MSYSYAVIGCGKPWKAEGSTGFGMAHRHVTGFKSAGCTLVATADIKEENAKAFADQHGDSSTRVFTDYHQMLAQVKPDIVSVCTWPALHAPMVLAAIDAGAKAVHCEKPMALTFGDSRRMHQRAVEKGCLLTFNHQRRFNQPFMTARSLLRDGVIGTVTRFDIICGNLYDWGTHWFDMLNNLNGDTPADWLLGQIDLRGRHEIFGAPMEGQGLSHIKFRNNVRATMLTGHELPPQAQFTVHGSDGTLEIEPPNCGTAHVRYRSSTTGGQWKVLESDEGIHDDIANTKGPIDLVTCLRTGREPELSSRKALAATELIFGTYESSRRRARVDLPLDIEDSPLADLIAKSV